MKILNKTQILSAVDIIKELVETPEWGEDTGVWVRGMTGKERDSYESRIYKIKNNQLHMNMEDIRAFLVSLCVIDENNNKLFSLQDVEALTEKSAIVLDRIASVIQRLSGLTPDQQKKLHEGLDKNPFVDSASN